MPRLAAILTLLPLLALAGTVSSIIEFGPQQVRITAHGSYSVVELDRGILVPEPGLPALPVVPLSLVIPPDAQIVRVSAEPLETIGLPGTHLVMPGQPPRPVSSTAPVAEVAPDPLAYAAVGPFPERLAAELSEGNAGGFRIASLYVAPLQYLPSERRLLLHSRLRVTVEYRAGARPAARPTEDQARRTAAGLRPMVANPADLERFAPAAALLDGQAIDYLVITGEPLASEFASFVDYRTRRGLRTELRTVEWIDCNYPGRDRQERTRNLIIDYYQNRGLSYVLLAGDNQIVPGRRIRVWVGDTRGDVPTDLYYGDLDYSWDSNNNNLFGEMNVDTVDLYADVIVGRASVDRPDEVQAFIAKVQTYENDPATDYIRRSLLPSGWLWLDIGYHGRFVNDSIAGLTPTGWRDVELVNPPNALAVADSFDDGYAVFDPAGHGNEGGVYDEDGTSIYTSSLARRQTNNRRFTIMTSLACTPGNFEHEDCLAEVAHNCNGGGCIAVMMNSRYGWGTPPSMGPSEKLCIRFYDHWLARGTRDLGVCHSRSREEYAGTAQWSSLWRWCMTEFNLFGDPAISIWDDEPVALAIAAADTVTSGGQTFSVTISADGRPLPEAVVCAWKQNEVFATATTNASGVARLTIHPVTAGVMTVTATKANCLAEEKTVTVVPGVPEPLITFQAVYPDDTGQPHPNGVLEPGESAALRLVLRNAGTAPAPGTEAVLVSLNPELVVVDSSATFGDIPPGDTAAAGFEVRASAGIFPGSTPELIAKVSADSRRWDIIVPLPVGYPGRVTAEIDTGACALTVTARGNVGFDYEGEVRGRGFRYPESETSSVNVASLCLARDQAYVVDRFYALAPTELDRDWRLVDSLHTEFPRWNSHQTLLGIFDDRGHPRSRDIRVYQRAVGRGPDDNFVIIVYDIVNRGTGPVDGLHAGLLADFDVKASDRLHDLAYTDVELQTAYMRNVNERDRVVGIQALYPRDLPVQLACLDHERYVYPDSGLSEEMKLRLMLGELGVAASDRPYNWSVSAGIGPFDLAPEGGRQRVAFAFVAASDSAGYLDACRNCREWFENNVGVVEPGTPTARRPIFTARPNPFTRSVALSAGPALAGPVVLSAYSAAGRLVDRQTFPAGEARSGLSWAPTGLPPGVYILKLSAGDEAYRTRVTLGR